MPTSDASLSERTCLRIIDCITLADWGLKRSCVRALKPFWSQELSTLKRLSFVHHKTWLNNGKPTIGVFYDNYISSRTDYRRRLRQEKRTKLQMSNERLYVNLIDKDTASFCRIWKSLSQSKDPLPPQIDGLTGNANIADRFSSVFYEQWLTSFHFISRLQQSIRPYLSLGSLCQTYQTKCTTLLSIECHVPLLEHVVHCKMERKDEQLI